MAQTKTSNLQAALCKTYKTCKTCKNNKAKTIQAKTSKVKKDKTHQAKASQVKKGQIKPKHNDLCTIVPRTKRFAYHCTENQTVHVPLCQTTRFAICCIGIWHREWELQGQCQKPSQLGLKEYEQSQKQQNKYKHSNDVSEPKGWQCTHEAKPNISWKSRTDHPRLKGTWTSS